MKFQGQNFTKFFPPGGWVAIITIRSIFFLLKNYFDMFYEYFQPNYMYEYKIM